MKKHINIILLLPFVLLFCSWGNTGHSIISYNAAAYFPASMTGFKAWADSLSARASDADYRKSSDNTEGPKHYIDIDMYSEFNSKGKIASTYDSIVKIHGSTFVIDNGTLPWATKNTYDSLKNSFKKRKWHKAVVFASDLGHYVADGHMPLHLTQYYDGRTSAQRGIHSRYESSMVGTYQNTLKNYSGYNPPPVTAVTNVNMYVLKYIYKNFNYMDSILLADDYAKSIDPNFSNAYTAALWNKTQFTKDLFKNASRTLAELIYSAWAEAGSPPYGSTPVEKVVMQNIRIYPNPTAGNITIETTDLIKAEIYSLDGKKQAEFEDGNLNIGFLPDGIYIISLHLKSAGVLNEKIVLKK